MSSGPDWFYHRNNCETCTKAQNFLDAKKVTPKEREDAKKVRYERPGALELASKADRLIATKGKKVIEVDLKKAKPSDDELVALLLGPSGKLRAPSMRVGKTLVVGFDETVYGDMLD